MRVIRCSFLQMIKIIKRDFMLFVVCLVPFLAGMAIKFVIPYLEKVLVGWTGSDIILPPYYGLFDLFFAALTPVMFCFVAAMVILEEHDDHTESYLFITGLGRKGYMVSRILLPALLAFIATVVLLPLFCLTSLSAGMAVLLALTGTLQGIIVALMIVTLSANKLEGMAITKMSTVIMLGAFIPFFLRTPLGYIASFLPSFWMGKAIYQNNPIDMLLAAMVAGAWIVLLLRKFQKKF